MTVVAIYRGCYVMCCSEILYIPTFFIYEGNQQLAMKWDGISCRGDKISAHDSEQFENQVKKRVKKTQAK